MEQQEQKQACLHYAESWHPKTTGQIKEITEILFLRMCCMWGLSSLMTWNTHPTCKQASRLNHCSTSSRLIYETFTCSWTQCIVKRVTNIMINPDYLGLSQRRFLYFLLKSLAFLTQSLMAWNRTGSIWPNCSTVLPISSRYFCSYSSTCSP